MRGVDATNRTTLFLLGLLLAVAGVLGLLLGLGIFGGSWVDDAVLPPAWSDYARTHAWVWWAVLAAFLLLAFVGLRWLLAQLRTDRVGRIDLTSEPRDGRTVLYAGALADAAAAHATRVPGVGKASAHLTQRDSRSAERLHVVADLTDRADLAAVRAALQAGVVEDARQAVGRPGMPVHIQLRVGAARSAGRELA